MAADDRRSGGFQGTKRSTYALVYSVAGFLFGLLFPLMATGIKMIQARPNIDLAGLIALHSGDPLLWIIDTAPLFLGLLAGYAGRRQDVLHGANVRLLAREQELTGFRTNLEQRVAERTKELQDRSILMRSLIDLTRQISEASGMPDLLANTAELIARNLGPYKVRIYLVDARTSTAVLQASAPQVDTEQNGAGRVLGMDAESAIGRAAAQKRVEIVVSSRELAKARPTQGAGAEALSEIALPLTARGVALGVLDIRPEAPRTFPAHELEALQLLSDHVAKAIDGARLFEDSRASLVQLESALRSETEASWRQYFAHQNLVLQYTPAGIKSVPGASGVHTPDGLQVPLDLRGWQIGSIALKRKNESSWTDAERNLVEKVAAQVALAIDNNRLLNETRQRALHEQTVSELSARFSQSVDLETLLRIAVREIASLPEVMEASVFLREDFGDSTAQNGPAIRGYKQDKARLEPTTSLPSAAKTAVDEGIVVMNTPGGRPNESAPYAAIPVRLRNQTLGAIHVTFQREHIPERSIHVIEQAADRLATALENTRLMQESMNRANRERLIGEIASKIGSSVSMRNVLQTAVEELGRALPGAGVTIRLRAESTQRPRERVS